ncbi:MAG TPA: AAA family ATPase, partial [Saprospiraceae bacterium]|nr:AAA family ATPase [Saprospiraceae bacterium]
MVHRELEENIKKRLYKGKVILILGPRQTGKTTLLKQLFSKADDILWLNGDEADIQNVFENPTSTKLLTYIGNKSTVIIDEAQRIKNIGIALKLLHDNKPDLQIVATCSSAFELANEVNEPLTGRKWEFHIFPISFAEMVNYHGIINEKRLLHHRLIYGYYP